jgi:putative addiction module component (TIGR02574 family)
MVVNDILHMNLEQKLYFMEQLWDSLRQEQQNETTPSWHKDILQNRKESYEKGDLKVISLEELKSSFDR